jgi:Ca2+-binding RTX toxin-like protein
LRTVRRSRIAIIAAMTLVKSISLLAPLFLSLLVAPEASAQTPATCSFDAEARTVLVAVNGQPAVLSASPSAGIRLDNVSCDGATLATTDSIAVTGSGFPDSLTLSNDFAPGATSEAGASEIEVTVSLGAGGDTIRFAPDAGDDVLVFTATGVDQFGDGDEDVTIDTATVEGVHVVGGPGQDVVDATLWPGGLVLQGGSEDDVLLGGAQHDTLHGDGGNDIIEGGPGFDLLFGGAGDDVEDGGDGSDRFRQENAANGADLMIGGEGNDWLVYDERSIGVTVTLDDGLANDGAPGEGDNVGVDVEHVIGSSGDDVIIGSDVANALKGRGGDDFLQGKAGRDSLFCSSGDDEAVGGPDTTADSGFNCEIYTE